MIARKTPMVLRQISSAGSQVYPRVTMSAFKSHQKRPMTTSLPRHRTITRLIRAAKSLTSSCTKSWSVTTSHMIVHFSRLSFRMMPSVCQQIFLELSASVSSAGSASLLRAQQHPFSPLRLLSCPEKHLHHPPPSQHAVLRQQPIPIPQVNEQWWLWSFLLFRNSLYLMALLCACVACLWLTVVDMVL